MRALLALSALLFAGTASADSMLALKSLAGAGENSITTIGCPQCEVAKEAPKSSYKVPDVPKGQSRIELKTINGEQMIVHSDAMIGGSPVMFISKATPEMIAALDLDNAKDTVKAADGIDISAKTSALDATPLPDALKAHKPLAAGMAAPEADKAADATVPTPAPKALDTASFSLRN